MFLKRELKQLGIEVTKKVEDEKIIELARQVATKLTVAFPKNNISYLEIYRNLLSTPMYYAKISGKMSEANYYYKNSTIYFSERVQLEKINEYIFHECIHKIQEHRDKKGNLTRMGLCEINEISVKAMALNEAAIQYIVSKALQNSKELVTIYDITLPTKTEYYPIITNLIAQIVYLIGEEVLVDSTINSNEDFKIAIIDNLGEDTFYYLEKNFNEILRIKNNIFELQRKSDDTQENINKILENMQNIKRLYIETQNQIFTSFFENQFKRIETVEEVSTFRRTLYSYRSLIGTTIEYDFFNSYCIDLDMRAKEKAEQIKINMSLAIVNDSKILKFIMKIKRMILGTQNEYNK